MEIEDLNRFNQLAESCGNRYLAVQLVAKWSRALFKETSQYHLLESKILTWVLTGHCPYVESQLNSRVVNHDDDYINEILEWVTDEDVVEEVQKLYKQSIHNHKLLECSNENLLSGQKSRANVLLRMIWYSNISKEGE